MTYKEKIRAEVDRLRKELVNGSGGLILGRTVHRYFNKIISLIDSTPEEPASEDLFGKREMPADEEKPNAEQCAPPYKEPEDITLFKIVRKLVELGAEFDIKAFGVHITNKSTEKKVK